MLYEPCFEATSQPRPPTNQIHPPPAHSAPTPSTHKKPYPSPLIRLTPHTPRTLPTPLVSANPAPFTAQISNSSTLPYPPT